MFDLQVRINHLVEHCRYLAIRRAGTVEPRIAINDNRYLMALHESIHDIRYDTDEPLAAEHLQ